MLQKALTMNAIFSLTSGLIILLTRKWLATQIPMFDWLWIFVGVNLLGFAAVLFLLRNNLSWAKKWTGFVVIADIAWVLITLGAYFIYRDNVTALGMGLVFGVNIVVGSLAYLQYKGWNQVSVSSPN